MASLAAVENDFSAGVTPPSHIAIIMDGNGRWASMRGEPVRKGHREGAEALRRILRHCKDLPHVTHLTVYAFSQENWKRPKHEIFDLMELLRYFFKQEIEQILKENVRIQFIGERAALEADIQDILKSTEARSAGNTRLTLSIALNYGSRQEIAKAAQAIAQKVAAGALHADAISADTISEHLDTAGTPDPDLLIRTGGDERLSNFLLWQSAYTELYFCDVLWPDFAPEHFDAAIAHFMKRERRFGGRSGA